MRAAASQAFRPPRWLRGGHRQTVVGHWLRRFTRWPLPCLDLTVDAGEGVRLLLRASWQPGPRERHPALVVVHGLGGSDASSYAVSVGRLAFARGWHVLRMNMRGSGDGEALCPLLYNAGLDTDLLAVVDEVARRVPALAVVGFSLGANLALLMLGRLRGALPHGLVAAVAVSPPVDLAACADAVERPANRLYQHRFMGMLRDAYHRRHRARPDLFPAGLERGLHTVRQYDERITAPFGGYVNAADYYARASAGPWLAHVDRPTLLLAAEDDPMIPAASVTRWPLSAAVAREITSTGGHVGFVGPTPAPGWFWAAERAMAFLQERLNDTQSRCRRDGDERNRQPTTGQRG
ncbi:MAG TPA: alpha/beta fold hydrolase [Vicinamibacteria bacterium]|nr:alpha/beta fold hydrolase [Vicinamibacteria bacterium]